jgi:rhodanese-related sulfurtransferase
MRTKRYEMGRIFTGVKNEQLTLTLLAAATVAAAAGLVLVEPKDFAPQVAGKNAPAVFHVGPNFLYRGKHIPGSVYAGPGSKEEGLAMLREAVAKLPRDREIVLYCGCCPWDRCPNVKPAVAALNAMGFTRVKALYVETNFKTDWIDKGYPVGQ